MRRDLVAVLFAASILTSLLATDRAVAGDDIDYSAPYVTLEDGELVTKYPAKEHVGGAQPTDSSPTDSAALSQEPTDLPMTGVIAAAVIGLALAVLLLAKRRRRQAD